MQVTIIFVMLFFGLSYVCLLVLEKLVIVKGFDGLLDCVLCLAVSFCPEGDGNGGELLGTILVE